MAVRSRSHHLESLVRLDNKIRCDRKLLFRSFSITGVGGTVKANFVPCSKQMKCPL